jgi:hypothetical protein
MPVPIGGDGRLLGDVGGEGRIADDAQRGPIRGVVGPLVEGAEIGEFQTEDHRFAPHSADVKAFGHTLVMRPSG